MNLGTTERIIHELEKYIGKLLAFVHNDHMNMNQTEQNDGIRSETMLVLAKSSRAINLNTPGRTDRENCILWRESAIRILGENNWERYFDKVLSCNLPSPNEPHHWVELIIKGNPSNRLIWDGTGQYLKNGIAAELQDASSVWPGYNDPGVERLQVLPELVE